VQVPPHDLDAEAAVLSGAMLSPIALSAVIDVLRPEHFFSESHRRMYEALVALHTARTPIDIVTVMTELRSRGRLEQVGGRTYIQQVLDSAPALSPSHVRSYAETVIDHWRVREAIALSQRIAAQGYVGLPSVQAYLDDSVRAFASIARQNPRGQNERVVDTLKRLVREMQAASDQRAETSPRKLGMLTGIEPFDRATGGLHAAQKTTVVALPGRGKTAFGLACAMTAALAGIGVMYFSGEMTRDELAERQLAFLACVDSRRIRSAKQRPTLTSEEWTRVFGALERASNLPLVIDDDHSLTIDDVRARTKRAHEQMPVVEKAPLGLVVLDYVQRLRAPAGFERAKKHAVVEYSTIGFKMLCQELKIAGVELAQQKTPDRSKASQRPELGMAADSFQIEKEADVVLYLHRDDPKDPRALTGLLVKQRGGGECEFELSFEPECGRFCSPRMEAASRDFVEPRREPPASAVATHAAYSVVEDDGESLEGLL
jgi:replicative DNA helicase